MRQISLVAISALLIGSLLAGCGGGDDSSDTTAASSSTANAGDTSSFCAAYAQVQFAGTAVKQLNSGNVSAAQVKQVVTKLGANLQALSSAASGVAGQAKSDVNSAADSFESQLKSTAGQPVSQQLITLGTAIDQLQSSLAATAGDLDCSQ